MIIHGDGLAGLESLDPGSVNLVLSDLPSGETAANFDVKPDLARLWPAVWRALKPNGNVVFMASSLRFAAELVTSQPNAYRYDLVWPKSIATGFLNAKHRPLRAHEFTLVFFRNRGEFHPQMLETGVRIHRNTTRGRSHGENYGAAIMSKSGLARAGATDRFPTSVLKFKCLGVRHPSRVHPQQKPDDMFRYLVRSYSSPGGLVVDPYAGSGTTDRAATDEGRRSICWEIQERFAVRKQADLPLAVGRKGRV